MIARGFPTAVLGLACLALIGCSNASDQELTEAKVVKGLLTPKAKPKSPSPAELAASVTAALAGTDQPLALVTLPRRNAAGVFQQIETNGPYRTFGTADRRSLTFRGGLLTATRGLGEDLMSSDVSAVTALIRGRKAGTATRVQRYLDGEDIITAISATCTVTPGGASQVQLVNGKRKTFGVSESCVTPQAAFENTYQVEAGTGRILHSKQWINAFNGYAAIQVLR